MSDTPRPISDYLTSRHRPGNVNEKHYQSLGFQDRLALGITSAIGTMYAVYFFILGLGGWILWQSYISNKPFDPFPFAFLLFLGNIVQLLLMPLIMVGQNIQGKHAEIRAEEEYQTTSSSYQDVEKILIHLDLQNKEILRLSNLVEIVKKQESK